VPTVLAYLLLAIPAAVFALLLAVARRSAPAERAVLALSAALLCASALLSPADPVNDQWTHYVHARAALTETWRFLDLWDRPGFMLLTAGPAAFGLRAARFASILTALVAIAATMRAAAALGVARPWMAGVLTLAQYDFFGQATSTMTELPFAAALAIAILGWAEDRPWVVAAGLGWMGIARPEGPAFVLLGAVGMLVRWRRAGPALAAWAPFVLHAVGGAILVKDPSWMLSWNPYRGLVTFRVELAQLWRSYFFRALALSQGAALILLEAVGLLLAVAGPARRLRFLLPVVGTTFLLLTFLKIGVVDDWRESRYLVSIAPALALLAAAGVDGVLERLPSLGPAVLLVAATVAGADTIAAYWRKVGVAVPPLWPTLAWAIALIPALLYLVRRRIPPAVALGGLLLAPLVAVPPGILSRHRADVVDSPHVAPKVR
jgi:hypothetical protein